MNNNLNKQAKEYADELMSVYECKDKALYHLATMVNVNVASSIQGMVRRYLYKQTIEAVKTWQPINLK